MMSLQAVIWPTSRETRVLITQNDRPILKACLNRHELAHPAALPALLDALALWQGTPIHAVLVATVSASTFAPLPGPLVRERFVLETWPVGLARPRARIDGLGSFRDLCQVLPSEARHDS